MNRPKRASIAGRICVRMPRFPAEIGGVETPPASIWRGSFFGCGLVGAAEEGQFGAYPHKLDVDRRGLNDLAFKTAT